MSKLNIYEVTLNNAYNIIKDNIYSCVISPRNITDVKFHHNISIREVPNILKYGLLSKKLKTSILENRELTEYEKNIYSDEFYVNGENYISLSSVEENFCDMYKGEFIWDPYTKLSADIIINSDVKSYRNTTNYFNEYLVLDKVSTHMFNSIDVKIFKIFNSKFFSLEKDTEEYKIKLLIEYYEYLKYIAIAMKKNNINIPLREISSVTNKDEYDKALNLDYEKVIELPKIKIK